MKKIFISIALILSLLLFSCSLFEQSQSSSNENFDPNSCSKGDFHEDENNNGKCDKCTLSVIVEFNLFVINDFHGKLSDSESQPGAEELSFYLKNEIMSEKNAILLSSGDMWQGGAESNLTKGIMVTEWMNELGFEAMTLGNHEYDWGEEYIIANSEAADFPFLAINVFDKDTDERVEYCEASVIIERAGLQIGVIGAIGDCYSSISADKTEGVYFAVGEDLTNLVKAESEKLRREGADFIIYSLHDGLGNSTQSDVVADGKLASYYDVSLSEGGFVDIVFEGHSHQTYEFRDTHGVYHLQAGGDNKGITEAEIKINCANGTNAVTDADIVSNAEYKTSPKDPYFNTLNDKYADVIAKANETLGNNPEFIRGNTLKQLVSQLYLDTGIKVWGDQYNIALGGGYISIRSPYNLYEGEVKYSDVMMLFPFDNEIVLCSIKGSDLKYRFLETSNSDYFISLSAYGESLRASIDSDATYYVVTDTYSSQYAPNRLTVVKTYDSETFARDLLAQYIKDGNLSK